MSEEISFLREHMAAQEYTLSRQLRAAQQAAFAKHNRSPAQVAAAAAAGDKQAAQALVAQIRTQENAKLQQLKSVRCGCCWECGCVVRVRQCV